MSKQNPLISILTPTYQCGKYLGEAICSILDQTYQNWEMLIIDDGSTDDTQEVIRRYATASNNRIRHATVGHHGYAAALNACYMISAGQLIARQDADDISHVDRLATMVKYLLEHPTVDIATCNMQRMDQTGRLQGREEGKPMDICRFMEGVDHGPPTPTIVSWRRVYEKVGPLSARFTMTADSEWNAEAITHGFRWGHVPEALYCYREHPGQMTKQNGTFAHAMYQQIVREKKWQNPLS